MTGAHLRLAGHSRLAAVGVACTEPLVATATGEVKGNPVLKIAGGCGRQVL
jgi:hypothetical protein